MFEMVPYSFKKNSATPDRIVVPDWGLFLLFYDAECVTFTYFNSLLYVGGRPLLHPPLYSEYKFDKCGFDGRLWSDKKMFTFWWCTDRMDFGKKEVLLWTQTICEKLKTGDWVVPSLNGKKVECPEKVDITEYTFMFIGIVNDVNSIIRCSYDEFIKGDFELYDCSKLRFFVPSNDSPYLRRVKIKREEPKEKSQYQLSCEYWDQRIGGMDVAEWHLLMYEE